MKLFRGCDQVENLRAVNKLPGSAGVNEKRRTTGNPWCKGYAAMVYRRTAAKWDLMGIHETMEEAVKAFDDLLDLAKAFPDVINPYDIGDMVIYASNGCDPRNSDNVRWYAAAIYIEE